MKKPHRLKSNKNLLKKQLMTMGFVFIIMFSISVTYNLATRNNVNPEDSSANIATDWKGSTTLSTGQSSTLGTANGKLVVLNGSGEKGYYKYFDGSTWSPELEIVPAECNQRVHGKFIDAGNGEILVEGKILGLEDDDCNKPTGSWNGIFYKVNLADGVIKGIYSTKFEKGQRAQHGAVYGAPLVYADNSKMDTSTTTSDGNAVVKANNEQLGILKSDNNIDIIWGGKDAESPSNFGFATKDFVMFDAWNSDKEDNGQLYLAKYTGSDISPAIVNNAPTMHVKSFHRSLTRPNIVYVGGAQSVKGDDKYTNAQLMAVDTGNGAVSGTVINSTNTTNFYDQIVSIAEWNGKVYASNLTWEKSNPGITECELDEKGGITKCGAFQQIPGAKYTGEGNEHVNFLSNYAGNLYASGVDSENGLITVYKYTGPGSTEGGVANPGGTDNGTGGDGQKPLLDARGKQRYYRNCDFNVAEGTIGTEDSCSAFRSREMKNPEGYAGMDFMMMPDGKEVRQIYQAPRGDASYHRSCKFDAHDGHLYGCGNVLYPIGLGDNVFGSVGTAAFNNGKSLLMFYITDDGKSMARRVCDLDPSTGMWDKSCSSQVQSIDVTNVRGTLNESYDLYNILLYNGEKNAIEFYGTSDKVYYRRCSFDSQTANVKSCGDFKELGGKPNDKELVGVGAITYKRGDGKDRIRLYYLTK